jgi:hypothetical protein
MGERCWELRENLESGEVLVSGIFLRREGKGIEMV